MDTHLTILNDAIVREREDALRRLDQHARNHESTASTAPPNHVRAAARTRRYVPRAELVVITMFAVLAAGMVSLVVSSLRL